MVFSFRAPIFTKLTPSLRSFYRAGSTSRPGLLHSLGIVLISSILFLGYNYDKSVHRFRFQITGFSRWAHERPTYVTANVSSEKATTDGFAYVTFLSSTVSQGHDLDGDVYFIATRILVWQLLYDPDTKTDGIDVVVLAHPDVDERRRERLRKDGATVRSVDAVHGKDDGWVVPKYGRWDGVMGKLHVWEMDEYRRILLLDGDMLLRHQLDRVFHDTGARPLRTQVERHLGKDEADLPDEYMLGSLGEVKNEYHLCPPRGWAAGDRLSDLKKPGYFNAGFFLLKPSRKLFDYYVGLLDLRGRFNPIYPEQNLLNYAHRWDGPMPWREIDYRWNIRWATDDDLDGGVTSLHEKWWEEPASGSQRVKDFFLSKRWQMERYYKSRDALELDRDDAV